MQRNPKIPFTYNYSQPSEYHFSIDSIEMPWEVAEIFKAQEQSLPPENRLAFRQSLAQMRVLDLCAGCGVIGFELNFHIPEFRQIDFVEVQSIYKAHFETNKSLVSNYGQFEFLNLNYEALLSESFYHRYDLVLCNPPYFLPTQGKLSPSEFKNRCRFYLDSTFEKLLEVLQHVLSPKGHAYILARSLQDHGIDFQTELEKVLLGQMHAEKISSIRGTDLLRLSHV